MEERLGVLENEVESLGQDDFMGAKMTGGAHAHAVPSQQGADEGGDGAERQDGRKILRRSP